MISPLLVPAALAFAPVTAEPAIPVPQQAIAGPVVSGAADPVSASPVVLASPAQRQDATVPATQPAEERHHHAKGDPLEGFNRTMFGIHQGIDHAVFRPAAMGYKQVVPRPLRSGLRNALSNLTEPFIFVNFLLQGKPGKAVETLGRFVVNSTFGVGGLFDVAKTKDFKLPHRPNGFGTTLAFYGVGPGPYIFLPFIGPTTLRDLLGNSADDALLPLVAGKPFNSMEYQLITGGIGGLDLRAESDADLRALFDGAADPYATLRSVYLQNRAAEVEEAKGHAATAPQQAAPELTDPLNDPELTGTQPEPPAPQSDAPELRDPLDDPEGTPAPQPSAPAPQP